MEGPTPEGTNPSFDVKGNKQTKKQELSNFVVHKMDIKIAEAVRNLLKAQLVVSFKECYIRQLHRGVTSNTMTAHSSTS